MQATEDATHSGLSKKDLYSSCICSMFSVAAPHLVKGPCIFHSVIFSLLAVGPHVCHLISAGWILQRQVSQPIKGRKAGEGGKWLKGNASLVVHFHKQKKYTPGSLPAEFLHLMGSTVLHDPLELQKSQEKRKYGKGKRCDHD